MQIINCDQGTPEWIAARLGIPTASAFSDVLAKGEGKSRKTYMMKLAGEVLTGEAHPGFSTPAMERGHEWEAEARDWYSFETGAQVQRVGFIRNGRAGCSPDGLIGDLGGLEIKTTEPQHLIPMIEAGKFPSKFAAQVQGNLWITGRQWWDLVVYWRGLPPFLIRARRDNGYIANLAGEVARFNDELDATVANVRNYKPAVAA